MNGVDSSSWSTAIPVAEWFTWSTWSPSYLTTARLTRMASLTVARVKALPFDAIDPADIASKSLSISGQCLSISRSGSQLIQTLNLNANTHSMPYPRTTNTRLCDQCGARTSDPKSPLCRDCNREKREKKHQQWLTRSRQNLAAERPDQGGIKPVISLDDYEQPHQTR